jgi:hypothetical protein
VNVINTAMIRAANVALLAAAAAAAATTRDSTGVPEQIGLNYGQTSGEMVASWAAWGGEKTGEVQYGYSSDNLNMTASTTGSTYTLKDYTSPFLYKAVMTGLQGGNHIYYYRVGSDETGYSDVHSFKSHPGSSKESITFHVLGDLGQTQNSANTLYQINDNEAALGTALSGGIVCMGDLSYANGDEPLWDSFGIMKEISTANIPMLNTPGNHEWFDDAAKNFTAYTARFDNPEVNGKEELYYSFNAGMAHWIMVAGYCTEMKSTGTQPCLQPGSAQMDWLQKDLASVDRSATPWTFVVFHQPYVNSNTAHNMASEGAPMQAAIEDVLYDSGIVDVVFSGHVHAYERSCRVYQYECVDGAPYYITIGDGGNAEGLATGWVSPQPDWSVYRQASYGHGELVVHNETHTLWQWHQNTDLSPTVADEFWVVKGESNKSGLGSMHSAGTTAEPIFADTERGRRGAAFDSEIRKQNFIGRPAHAHA